MQNIVVLFVFVLRLKVFLRSDLKESREGLVHASTHSCTLVFTQSYSVMYLGVMDHMKRLSTYYTFQPFIRTLTGTHLNHLRESCVG